MDSKIILENEYLNRLNSLLEYSLEAIRYWYDHCDVTTELLSENSHYEKECLFFIEYLKLK